MNQDGTPCLLGQRYRKRWHLRNGGERFWELGIVSA